MPAPRPYNAIIDMVDRNVDRGLGDKTAFVDPARRLSYGELQRQTNRVADMLTGLGLRREERIGLLMHDTVDYPAMFWGALRAGVVPVCLNTLLTGAQYGHILADSRVRALFVAAPLLEVVAPLLSGLESLRHVVVVGGGEGEGDGGGEDEGVCGGAEHASLASLLAAAAPRFETVETCSDECAFWLYSSGSTGLPKGVPHVHASPRYVADTYGANILGIREDDICFAAAKLFFAYGLGAGMAVPMSAGATTVLLPGRPTPRSVLATMRRFVPTLFFGVPTLYAALLADAACRPENGSPALRLCVSAGEALPAEVGRAWRDRMGTDIIDGIGSTEMLHVFLSNRPGDIRYGTSGREIPGYRLRLVNEEGREAGVDELGELLVSGGSAGMGYWNQRAKTRATFAGEWVHTGDRFTRDAEGYYHYCGRTDDMFKVSGRWVSPFEVEQALVAHPAVLEAAVVAHEDENGLIKPRAFVVLKPGVAPEGLFEALKDSVKAAVGVWKYPRRIDFVDALPKTATGKIQRFRLRRAAGGRGGQKPFPPPPESG